MKRLFNIIPLILLTVSCYPQNLSNKRSRELILAGDSIRLDTLSIIPGSVLYLDDQTRVLPDSLFLLDHSTGWLKWKRPLRGTGVEVYYRVFPFRFSKTFSLRDTGRIRRQAFMPSGIPLTSAGQGRDVFSSGMIDKRGSISRGIITGNNQDLSVSSGLNLQLSGRISDDLNIMAAISDANIPLQPDGTSQQIRDFDRVYIRLYNQRTRLTAGDFEIAGPPGHFMQFSKKLQGGEFSSSFGSGKKPGKKVSSTLAAAVSKGKYNRNFFIGQEGTQGPYTLKGANNERYIIVLAGSERVYIDGELMQRGIGHDYTVDYNRAEITFTPNRPITKDKRITVEFEYSEKNYARFLLHNSNVLHTKNGAFWLNVYSEHDARNQTLRQDLDREEKSLLDSIGDHLEKAVILNVDSVDFNQNEVLYRKTDTTVNGRTYPGVFVFSADPARAVYRVGFSYVGENRGNYVSASSAVNGKVYRWVAPENGVRQGTHEPVRRLVAPESKQLFTLGGRIRPGRYTQAGFELGLSNHDLNSFSGKGNRDNTGYALQANLSRELLRDTGLHRLVLSAAYERRGENFSPVERYRPVEFQRDWNLSDDLPEGSENQAELTFTYNRKNLGHAGYSGTMLSSGSGYSGFRNILHASGHRGSYALDLHGSYMHADDPFSRSGFLRHHAEISRKAGPFRIGLREESEQNLWKNAPGDSLLTNSFSWQEFELFIRSPDTVQNRYLLSYKRRMDRLPAGNRLEDASTGQSLNLGAQLSRNPDHNLTAILNFRKLDIPDTSLLSAPREQSLTTRVEHRLRILGRAVAFSTFYETGNGLETRKEYSYIEVAHGQGIYRWADYNQNGIRELDEFEIARFRDEARFIRVFIPSRDYIQVHTNQFNHSIHLNPAAAWGQSGGFGKFVSRFSNRFAFRMNGKKTAADFFRDLYPGNYLNGDAGLLNLSSSLRNALSFNRASPVFGIDHIYQFNRSRNLLANGTDTRSLRSNSLKARWNTGQSISLLDNAEKGIKEYQSEFFSDRNYRIGFMQNDLSFRYQPGLRFRFTLSWLLARRKNELNIEEVTENNLGTGINYGMVNNINLSARGHFVYLSTNAASGTSIAYEMLNGLQPGRNGTWELILRKRIAGGIELNLRYEGRISENEPSVHTGMLEVRASF